MAIPLSVYDTMLLRKLREAFEADVIEKSGQVSSGVSKGDAFDYGKRCGYISGVNFAIDQLDEVAKKLMGEDRGD